MSQNFQQALAEGVVVFDGAMGTEIYRHHVFTNRSFDELCLSDPKLIRQIHLDYRDAGADVLTTNTFSANRVALEKFGLAEKLRDIHLAGAEFAITQPVFDPEALLRFLDHVEPFGLPIIAGIWPLASYRNASFMRNEVPGVVIPDWIMDRMSAVTSRDDQLRTGIEIARESVARIRSRVAGIQVSAPLGRVDAALAVIEE